MNICEKKLHTDQIRRLIIKSISSVGSGHVGGSLSCVEILVSIFGGALKHINNKSGWPYQNRLIFSKGHAEAAYYSVLCEAGHITFTELMTMRTSGSRLQGHPDSIWLPDFVEFTGGSLGQGLSFGLGLALGLRSQSTVFVVLGDGELQEGQIWEAILTASRLNISNLVAVVDWNGFQLSGRIQHSPNIEEMAQAWRMCGWEARICDGHSITELSQALSLKLQKPLVIFAKTIKGRGISFMENNNDFHGRSLSENEVFLALGELSEGST